MLWNTKIKLYKDGSKNIYYSKKPCFSDKIYKCDVNGEVHEKTQEEKEKSKKKKHLILFGGIYEEVKKSSSEVREDNLKRAKDKIYDISYENDFEYFITATINPNEYENKDVTKVYKMFRNWLSNRQKRNGLQYLIIPEYHKNGNIHIHGLIKGNLTMIDSGRLIYQSKAYKAETLKKKNIQTENLKTVYNISDWKFGYSTAIKLDDNKVAISRYITKYITKGNNKIFGRYYLSSKGIVREPKTKYTHTDGFDNIPLPTYEPWGVNNQYKYDLQIAGISHCNTTS